MELKIQNVSMTYPSGKQALKGLNLDLKSPSLIGLLGPNGAGKSTLMKLLVAALMPTEGSILVDGAPLNKVEGKLKASLGYLPQDFGLFEELTVTQFLDYMAALKGLRSPQAAIRDVIRAVNLEEKARARIRTLSGGQRQRVGIAQALLGEPPVLVVDEPTAGLDPEERVRFRGVLSRYARQGRTVLLSTHIVEDVHQLCQHLAVLRKGRLFYAGPSQELLHQVEGRVKVLPLGNDRELAALQRQAVVLSTTYEQNAILARVVDESGRFPQPPVPATLEDAYVYCMGGKSHA